MTHRIRVDLGPRSYDVIAGAGALNEVAGILEGLGEFDQIALITDENLERLYADDLQKKLLRQWRVGRLVVAPGERSKSWAGAGELLEQMASLELRRRDVVLALGGGMITDLAGFVASSYQRGLKVVHVATSLLGQVDAAIGGKTGVNLSAGKNLAGAFHQPSAVIADTNLLASLPERELRCGFAEVVKYGLCFDPSILEYFSKHTFSTPADLEQMVCKCAQIKAGVVSSDETDRAQRVLLNYGHTVGHALEAEGGYGSRTHGEAISVGMMFAAHAAVLTGMAAPELIDAHSRALEAAGLPVRADFDAQRVARLWAMDKKHLGGPRWVLLEAVGRPVVRSGVSEEVLAQALEQVRGGS